MVIYSVIHKRVFTPLRDLPTRIIEAIDHSSNSTMAFAFTKNPRIFCKCKCYCWVSRMVDSLYYSSRKIQEGCENTFVNYRIYYQKLCDLMRQITKELNWPNLSIMGQWRQWVNMNRGSASNYGFDDNKRFEPVTKAIQNTVVHEPYL